MAAFDFGKDKFFSKLTSKLDISKIDEYVDQVRNVVPMMREMIPMIIQESEAKYGVQLESDEILMYSMAFGKNEKNEHEIYILFYCVATNEEGFTYITREIDKYTLTDLEQKLPSWLRAKKDSPDDSKLIG